MITPTQQRDVRDCAHIAADALRTTFKNTASVTVLDSVVMGRYYMAIKLPNGTEILAQYDVYTDGATQ